MKLEHLQAMKAKATLQSRHAVITDDMVCQVCRRPFSTLSAPAIYPNMSIVHVACALKSCSKCRATLGAQAHHCPKCFTPCGGERLTVDPLTHTDFVKVVSEREQGTIYAQTHPLSS